MLVVLFLLLMRKVHKIYSLSKNKQRAQSFYLCLITSGTVTIKRQTVSFMSIYICINLYWSVFGRAEITIDADYLNIIPSHLLRHNNFINRAHVIISVYTFTFFPTYLVSICMHKHFALAPAIRLQWLYWRIDIAHVQFTVWPICHRLLCGHLHISVLAVEHGFQLQIINYVAEISSKSLFLAQ